MKIILMLLIIINIVFSYADTQLTIEQGSADFIENVDTVIDIYEMDYNIDVIANEDSIIQSELNKIKSQTIKPIQSKKWKIVKQNSILIAAYI